MKVKKVAFGNKNEAFVEDRLSDGLNIIFSDDNNRGKTLLLQGLMYSIGYDSIFPSSFDYKDHYFFSEIVVGDQFYRFLRKKNSIIVNSAGAMQLFNSVSELKYFIDKNIFTIPRIEKDGRNIAVDLSLFYELFFIGQDGRNPSGLISKGRFNKTDFKNMIYSIAEVLVGEVDVQDIEEIKNEISRLKIKLRETRKKISIIKSNPDIAEIFSRTYDSERVQKKVKAIDEISKKISSLKRARQREIARRSKLQQLTSELNSLNRELSEGKVKCGECGSEKIVYSNDDLTFEVSNIDVRNGILRSIHENISQKSDIIYEYTQEISELQHSLTSELSDAPPNFQQLMVYQDQVESDINYDDEAFSITQEIGLLNEKLSTSNSLSEELKSSRLALDDEILSTMKEFYETIDPNGNLEFTDIFSKRDSTFSGSEGQEFYFCKVLALKKVLNHEFPIMVDSFRDGELSTVKEQKMLDIYSSKKSQIILTSTLKDEEYEVDKYGNNKSINAIDYSSHDDCKILSKDYSEEFSNLLSGFGGLLV